MGSRKNFILKKVKKVDGRYKKVDDHWPILSFSRPGKFLFLEKDSIPTSILYYKRPCSYIKKRFLNDLNEIKIKV